MAGSSQGPRRATPWAAEQSPRPSPRIVRLGRPANDNVRRLSPAVGALLVVLAAAAAVTAIVHWGLQ